MSQLHSRHLAYLEPVLEALLSTGSARACARLILHLEDKALTLLFSCLNALLHPFNRRKIKLPPREIAAVRRALLPHKRLFLTLSQPGEPTRKRTQLSRALQRDKGAATSSVLAGFVRTLQDVISSSKKKKGAPSAAKQRLALPHGSSPT